MPADRRPLRLACIAVASLCALACARTAASETETAETSETSSSSDTSTSEDPTDDTSTTDDPTGEPPTGVCDCAVDEVCAANCQSEIPGFPMDPNAPYDYRCVSDPACVPGEDLDTPDCREAACGDPYVPLLAHCGDPEKSPEGLDMICASYSLSECDVAAQDCPEGEKCMFVPFDDATIIGHCVPIVGMDAPGDPCTGITDPDFEDSCDADGMCWSQDYPTASFDGVCRSFCNPDLDPPCPDPSTCETLAEGFELCTIP